MHYSESALRPKEKPSVRGRARRYGPRARQRHTPGYCSWKLKEMVPVTFTGCPESSVGEKRHW